MRKCADSHDEQCSGLPSVSDKMICENGRNNSERSKGDESGTLQDER